jgi:hypothetical protein
VRVLIVGAGAVGQVYGRHLQAGGAAVSFFVREKYRAAAESGFTVYPLNRRDRSKPERFEGFGVTTTLDEVRATAWDQVWLAVSSPALRQPWLAELVDAAPGAVFVGLTPGVDDRDLLLTLVPADRLVQGLISLISYQAPLPGEARFSTPGMAWWFPPFGPSPFAGPDQHVTAIVSALRKGGQPAKRTTGLAEQASLASATLMPILLALESVDWSWSALRSSDALALATAGSREAITVTAARLGRPPPPTVHVMRPSFLRLLMAAAPIVVPLDLETYLAWHFTKVGAQTRMYARRYLELAADQGRATPALEALISRIAPEAPDATEVSQRVSARLHGAA